MLALQNSLVDTILHRQTFFAKNLTKNLPKSVKLIILFPVGIIKATKKVFDCKPEVSEIS